MLREDFEKVMDVKLLDQKLSLLGFVVEDSLAFQWVNSARGLTVLATPRGACLLRPSAPSSTPFTNSVEELVESVHSALRDQGFKFPIQKRGSSVKR